MQPLPHDERRLLILRLRQHGFTQREIAAQFHLSQERIRQLEQRALRELRNRNHNHAARSAYEMLDWCRDSRSRLIYTLHILQLLTSMSALDAHAGRIAR